MQIRFDDKVVIVIGGSTGIGAETSKAFLQAGAIVVASGLEPIEKLDREQFNNRKETSIDYYQLDVTKESEVKKFVAYVKEKYQKCDVLFNNAGILEPNRLHETPTEQWLKTVNVNLNGVYYTSKHILQLMIKNKGGAIINTSSISGLKAEHTFASYNATKGAIANLTRNMALDYAEYNIRVNAVAPGSIRTSMYYSFAERVGGKDVLDYGTEKVYPLRRVGYPADIANAVLFLASDQASFITGVNLKVDGGITAHTGAQHEWEEVRKLLDLKNDK